MSNELTSKKTCNACGHIISKTRTNLSATNFRLCVNNIKDLDGLIKSKEYLAQFIGNRYHSSGLKRRILEILEDKIEEFEQSPVPLEDLERFKLWLLDTINKTDISDKEMYFYEYIRSNYSSIYETFTDFYNKYAYTVNDPLNKNRISRLLTALGLKTITKKINIPADNKSGMRVPLLRNKCCVFLNVPEDKLSETFKKNGLNQ